MTVLAAAVVFVGTLCTLNILLTFGVIRRLREHTVGIEQLSARNAPGWHPLGPSLSAGETVGRFQADTLDDETVSQDRLAGATVVFLDAECDSCYDRLPDLLTWANSRAREQIFVVISGGAGERAGMVEALNPLTQVILDGSDLRVSTAFRIRKFPAYCTLDDEGRVTAFSEDLDRLISGDRR